VARGKAKASDAGSCSQAVESNRPPGAADAAPHSRARGWCPSSWTTRPAIEPQVGGPVRAQDSGAPTPALCGFRAHAGRRTPGQGGIPGESRDAAKVDDQGGLVASALAAGEDGACVAAALPEQLRGEGARSQFGRALKELGIEWIAAHSPQAKGRIERLFETLQDRLVKEMRLAGIDSIQGANHFLEMHFLPEWEQRFTVAPRLARNAHRRLGQEHRLEEILSVRAARKVAQDHTVSWEGNRWGVSREEVCAGLRGAQVEIERRLDGSHWLRFRNRYLRLRHCAEPAPRAVSPSGLRPPVL